LDSCVASKFIADRFNGRARAGQVSSNPMQSRRGKSGMRKSAPTRRKAKHKGVELNAKAVPRQLRAQATYEAILEVTGNLLEEVGVDRLSTNLVCQRAGLTPPALYRYFPNKYALLRELGARLMQAQDDAVFEHIAAQSTSFGTVEQEALKNREILERVNAITRKFPGGAWVMRTLRAVPALSAVRVKLREELPAL
jgi:AcrR family transcriptional regulator